MYVSLMTSPPPSSIEGMRMIQNWSKKKKKSNLQFIHFRAFFVVRSVHSLELETGISDSFVVFCCLNSTSDNSAVKVDD